MLRFACLAVKRNLEEQIRLGGVNGRVFYAQSSSLMHAQSKSSISDRTKAMLPDNRRCIVGFEIPPRVSHWRFARAKGMNRQGGPSGSMRKG